MSTDAAVRIEHDLLGELAIPECAYYGIHTSRALDNFPITGIPISSMPDLVRALASVKAAAALANKQLSLLPDDKADAIVEACYEIRAGRWHEQFVVDVIQGGAGTSTNMNANEVIANRALELMGYSRGTYARLHPNEHVNLCQSTNDVYPTTVKVALYAASTGLVEVLQALRKSLDRKATEFADILKIGRTQLQDAVPMTLGQEFAAFSTMVEDDERRLVEAMKGLCEINLGATAIGTGINAHPDYSALVCQHLRRITGMPLLTAKNLIAATQDVSAFVELSGVLKRIALKLSKICNDLRLLSSGPRAGLNEIGLPPVQAGSSIMPGKVNPVIPEVVNQIAYEVIGNDLTVSFAAENGQLQLNAFEPVIANSLFKSIKHLRAGCLTLTSRCIEGITANVDGLKRTVENSVGVVTALSPFIGYANATLIAREALDSGRSVHELVLTKGLLSSTELERILCPSVMTRPNLVVWKGERNENR
jgi:aspartate ammonia-lyase